MWYLQDAENPNRFFLKKEAEEEGYLFYLFIFVGVFFLTGGVVFEKQVYMKYDLKCKKTLVL